MKGQHVYLVTFDGTGHALYLDGKPVAATKTAYAYSMSGYQLGGVHGGSGSARPRTRRPLLPRGNRVETA